MLGAENPKWKLQHSISSHFSFLVFHCKIILWIWAFFGAKNTKRQLLQTISFSGPLTLPNGCGYSTMNRRLRRNVISSIFLPPKGQSCNMLYLSSEKHLPLTKRMGQFSCLHIFIAEKNVGSMLKLNCWSRQRQHGVTSGRGRILSSWGCLLRSSAAGMAAIRRSLLDPTARPSSSYTDLLPVQGGVQASDLEYWVGMLEPKSRIVGWDEAQVSWGPC